MEREKGMMLWAEVNCRRDVLDQEAGRARCLAGILAPGRIRGSLSVFLATGSPAAAEREETRAVGGGRRDDKVWTSLQRVGGENGPAVRRSRLPTPTHTPTFFTVGLSPVFLSPITVFGAA